MRKLASLFVIFILLVSQSGCWLSPETSKPDISEKAEITELSGPFSFDYPSDESSAQFFLENDDFEVLAMAGPYYQSTQTLNFPDLKKFENARAEVVAEAIGLTAQTFESAKALKIELEVLRQEYLLLWENSWEVNQETAKEALAIILEQQLIEDTLQSSYENITSNTSDSAVNAALEMHKTAFAVQFAESVSNNFAEFLSLTFVTTPSLGDVSAFEKKMDDSGIFELLSAMQNSYVDLGISLNQLNTADYYLALASSEFIDQNISNIKAQIQNIQESPDIDAADIEFLKNYADFFAQFSTQLKSELSAFDQSALLDLSKEEASIFPRAHAAGGGYFSSALSSLASGVKSLAKGAVDTVDKGLSYTGVKGVYQKGVKVVGIGLEGLNAATKSGMDMVIGTIEGNSMKDIGESIMDNFKEMDTRIKNGTAGADILKTAGEYLDEVENFAESSVEAGVSKITGGKGNMSWLAGKVGKLTAGLFTGFGKGIYKIGNAKASQGEVAEGLLDVGLSFIGGSTTIFKGSAALKGGGKSLLELGKDGLTYLGKAAKNVHLTNLKNIKNLSPSGISSYISNAAKNTFNEVLQAEYSAIFASLKDKLKTGASEGLEGLIKGGKETAKSAYDDFVKKVFDHTLKGYTQAITQVLGGSFDGYIDNIIANLLENEIKTVIKEGIDNAVAEIQAEQYPPIEEIAGTWPGTLTITEVDMTDEFRKKAAEDGCDVEEIEQSKGQVKPVSLHFTPTSDSGGTATMTGEDIEPQEMPFTYIDGVLKASFNSQGAVLNFNMSFQKEASTGTMDMDFMEGQIKMRGDMNIKKN